MINDFCAWFKAIEADPFKQVQMTIGELHAAREHVAVCVDCYNICEEVDRKYPPSNTSFASEN